MASSVSRAAGAAATMAKAGWRAVAQGFSPPFLDQASQISSPPALFSGLRTLGCHGEVQGATCARGYSPTLRCGSGSSLSIRVIGWVSRGAARSYSAYPASSILSATGGTRAFPTITSSYSGYALDNACRKTNIFWSILARRYSNGKGKNTDSKGRGNPEAPKIDVLERVRGSQSQGRAPQQGKRE
uniref:Uncharacterized protein n=1 Tax=Oryza meridionalis TaxID=40149 RepID=A0A0E0CIV8_9ORYZ